MKKPFTQIFYIFVTILAIIIFTKFRPYIGYYIALLAIPYGIYGLFIPYKSAVEYAKKGCVMLYSRQFGSLMLSLGILAIFYSAFYSRFSEHMGFLIVLLLYLMLFFGTLYLLNKRYIRKL